MASAPIICCVKWGTKYPPDYVNRLRNMVRRHLQVPHEFICLTEDPAGLDRGIGTFSLPSGLPGYWNKVSLFRAGTFEPGRTIVYLDLDVVIVGALDFLLNDPGGFRIIKAFSVNPGCNSSVMRFQAGEQPHLYERFVVEADTIMASEKYPGDQDWIFEQAADLTFFPPGKIVSYKKDMPSHVALITKKLSLDFRWVKAPRWMSVAPPPDAAIVVFHGKPDPEDVMDAPFGPWKRAPFVKAHWR